MPWRTVSIPAAAPLIALAVVNAPVTTAPADDAPQVSTQNTTQVQAPEPCTEER